MDKNRLREIALEKRKALNPEIKTESDLMIQKHAYEKIKDKKTVGFYVSKKDEVKTLDLIQWCLDDGMTVAVPKVKGKKMDFIQIHSLDELSKGTFAVMEPSGDTVVDLSDFEAMIVPVVGFDALRHRIGYGGGYYDSALDKTDCMKIGLAYAVTQVENFLSDPHDINMDVILTEYSEI